MNFNFADLDAKDRVTMNAAIKAALIARVPALDLAVRCLFQKLAGQYFYAGSQFGWMKRKQAA